jgi:hypothetical protein
VVEDKDRDRQQALRLVTCYSRWDQIMTKIITVHGTNAGNPSDEGEHWWQRNSPFQKRLSTWLNLDGVEFEPFHWNEGPNSELARRWAGERLLKRLKELEKSGEDYYLIGHSHGGSVIHHALLAASANGLQLKHLRNWLTIGTPFLWTKPNWLAFRRLGSLGKVAYVYAIAILFGVITGMPIMYFYGRSYFHSYTQAAAGSNGEAFSLLFLPATVDPADFVYISSELIVVPLALFVLLFIWLGERRMRSRYARKTQTFFLANYIPRWQSLRSRQDEAITMLRTTGPLKLTLFYGNLLVQPTKTLIVTVITLFAIGSLTVSAVLFYKFGFSKEYVVNSLAYGQKYFGWVSPKVSLDLQQISSEPMDVRSVLAFYADHALITAAGVIGIIVILLFYFGLAWLFFALVGLIAHLAGFPTSFFLNRITADQVRRSAFGNDTIGERVTQVAAVPQGCDADFGLVPEEIEATLTAFSDKNAVKTLASVRHVLGLDTETQSKRDVASIVAKQLSWHELIHTSYFDVDEFAKLIGYVLHRAGLASLSESFRADPDYEKIKLAYDHLPPLVQTTDIYPKRKSRPFRLSVSKRWHHRSGATSGSPIRISRDDVQNVSHIS